MQGFHGGTMQELRRKIQWFEHTGSIAQVYSSGLEYAFCTADFKQHLPWVYCKDFLHDAIYSYLHGTKLSIYGYSYDPTSHDAPNLRRMRLLVTNKSDAEFADKVTNSIDFINQVEKAMHIPSISRVFRCPEPPAKYNKCGVYMFSGSGQWLISPPMVSLYTLVARSGFSHVAGTPYTETIDKIIGGQIPGYQTNDMMQLRDAKTGIERLIREGYRKVFSTTMRENYPPNIAISNMHNYFGIVSFSKELTKAYAPQWHEATVPAVPVIV
jgi:hypothetical protein